MSTIAEASVLAKHYMKAGIPSFMEGAPGIGKTETWEQIAKDEGMSFIPLELGLMDPVDLRGLPNVSTDANGVRVTEWARPDFWPVPERNGNFGIILFDEMSDLSKAMQSAAYSPVLNGRSGPHVLPPFDYANRTGWYRAAAGNRRADKAAAQPMSTALASRFGWINVEPDVASWVRWGQEHGVSDMLLGFIRWKPDLIHRLRDGDDERAFPCPRQWTRVSRVINAPRQERFLLIKGLVGEGAATEFEGWLKTVNLPTLEEILKDPRRIHIPDEPGTKYAISSLLARNANRENFDKILEFTKRREFGRDFEICCVLDATKRDIGLVETRAFVDFSTRNHDLTVN